MTGHYWMSFDPIWDHFENVLSNWNSHVVKRQTKLSHMPSYPHSDVWVGDEGKELWMRFALAGYASENVNVKAAGKTVRVIAKSEEEPDVKFVHHGISNKNVDFTLNIDEGFDPQKAKVTFKEGMLTIVIPRSKGNEIIDLM
jgi:HSP20 family molecular chaperone IbpA